MWKWAVKPTPFRLRISSACATCSLTTFCNWKGVSISGMRRHVGLVSASQLLNRPPAQKAGETLKVVVIRERDAVYGVAVERFIGERTLVVMPLDPRPARFRTFRQGPCSTTVRWY